MEKIMASAPSMVIGGNQVQPTESGKVRVTNKYGKVKTLSEDQFKKQVLTNMDKIQKGEDFEFKKNSVAKIITIAAVSIAALVGLGYAGKKGKLGKTIEGWLNKAAEGVKNLTKKGETEAEKGVKKFKTAADKKAYMKNQNNINTEYAKQSDAYFKERKAITATQREDAKSAFNGIKSKKDLEALESGSTEDLQKLVNKKRADLAGHQVEIEEKDFVSLKDIKNKKNHGVKVDPKMKAEWEAAHPELKSTKKTASKKKPATKKTEAKPETTSTKKPTASKKKPATKKTKAKPETTSTKKPETKAPETKPEETK